MMSVDKVEIVSTPANLNSSPFEIHPRIQEAGFLSVNESNVTALSGEPVKHPIL